MPLIDSHQRTPPHGDPLMQHIDPMRSYSRERLKSMAFVYHYGVWASEEVAKASLSYRAAKEMARRGGYRVPRPVLITLGAKDWPEALETFRETGQRMHDIIQKHYASLAKGLPANTSPSERTVSVDPED